MTNVRVRFAPSPTGLPHVGNIRTALFNYLFARHNNGKFIYRIEDTDRNRFVEDALEKLQDAMTWLGIEIDEGYGVGGDFGPYVQSERLGIYEQVISEMISKGRAYICDCSKERLDKVRENQRSARINPHYDGKCREKNISFNGIEYLKKMKAVIRFASPKEGETKFTDLLRGDISFKNITIDDIILIKADGFPTYNFANVVDDHFMEITHVMRGDEFISSTHKHVNIYSAMDWKPPCFVHLSVILSKTRKKLSKREGSVYIGQYREIGILPEALVNFLALLGWSPGKNEEILDCDQLIKKFTLKGITIHPAIFDMDKLLWINSVYISKMSGENIFECSKQFLVNSDIISDDYTDIQYASTALDLLKTRLPTFKDSVERASYFFKDPEIFDEKGWRKRIISVEKIDVYLNLLVEKYLKIEKFNSENAEFYLREVAQEFDIKASVLIHAVRISVSGMTTGPGLFEILHVLGKDSVIRRIKKVIMKYSEKD